MSSDLMSAHRFRVAGGHVGYTFQQVRRGGLGHIASTKSHTSPVPRNREGVFVNISTSEICFDSLLLPFIAIQKAAILVDCD
jgi:hypothetical protein